MVDTGDNKSTVTAAGHAADAVAADDEEEPRFELHPGCRCSRRCKFTSTASSFENPAARRLCSTVILVLDPSSPSSPRHHRRFNSVLLCHVEEASREFGQGVMVRR